MRDGVQAVKVEEKMKRCREQQGWTATQKKTGGDSRATSQPFTELNSCHLHLSDSLDIASRRKVKCSNFTKVQLFILTYSQKKQKKERERENGNSRTSTAKYYTLYVCLKI